MLAWLLTEQHTTVLWQALAAAVVAGAIVAVLLACGKLGQ